MATGKTENEKEKGYLLTKIRIYTQVTGSMVKRKGLELSSSMKQE